jgi:hypothetical protein
MIAHWRGVLPVLVVLEACATPPAPLVAPRVRSGVELAPFAEHMECMALENGERVTYRFAALAPVAFSIQLREDSAVIIPVEIKSTVGEEGDFAAQDGGSYCLTWEAGALGSVIEYRVQPVRPRR